MTPGKRNKESGAAIIEFVILMVFIALPLVFGIIDFGFIWAQKHYMTEAVHEGARAGSRVAEVAYDATSNTYTLSNLGDINTTVVDAVDRHLQGLPLFGGKLADELDGNPPTVELLMVTVSGSTDPTPTLRVSSSVTIANLWVPVLWDLLQLITPGAPNAPASVGSTAVFPILQ